MSQRTALAERVSRLRSSRENKGLRRREIYVYDDDWPALRSLVMNLRYERELKNETSNQPIEKPKRNSESND
jgi:hypothetical protein